MRFQNSNKNKRLNAILFMRTCHFVTFKLIIIISRMFYLLKKKNIENIIEINKNI